MRSTVAVFAKTDGINLGFRYDRGRFDQDQIRYLQACLSRLLAQIVTDAAAPLGELTGLDVDEVRQVLAWSGGAIEFDRNPDFGGGIVARIEAQRR